MSEYKYPYIPKDYYPAVMYACNCIKKYGTFNVACEAAANKYGVDSDIVKKHVRARQGAGQKNKTRSYKYYVVVGWTDKWLRNFDYDILLSQEDHDKWKQERKIWSKVIKATSQENAKKQIPSGTMGRDSFLYGEHITDCELSEFETQNDAEAELDDIVDSYKKRC